MFSGEQDRAQSDPVAFAEVTGIGEGGQAEFVLTPAPGGADTAPRTDPARTGVSADVAQNRAIEPPAPQSTHNALGRRPGKNDAGVVSGGDLGGDTGLGQPALDQQTASELAQ